MRSKMGKRVTHRLDINDPTIYKVELVNNAPAGTDFFPKRKRWAHKHCQGEWDWTVSESNMRNPVFLFADRNDALRFKLTWVGKQEVLIED